MTDPENRPATRFESDPDPYVPEEPTVVVRDGPLDAPALVLAVVIIVLCVLAVALLTTPRSASEPSLQAVPAQSEAPSTSDSSRRVDGVGASPEPTVEPDATGGIGEPLEGVNPNMPDTASTREVRGTASHVGRAFGRRYLALPEHRWGRPGLRVQVCGPGSCVERTSTDAGPDKSMQRAGRIADLNWYDFRTVCGVRVGEPDPGLCQVIVTYLDPGQYLPSLPPTSTERRSS